MAVSEELLAYVLDQFAKWGQINARKMFGGVGLYLSELSVAPGVRFVSFIRRL
jgi:TfoX/Sxy family transcriptional regulator of competence genes